MAPQYFYVLIYDTIAISSSVSIATAASFALGDVLKFYILAFMSQASPEKSLTVLSFISHGQTRAHVHIQDSVVQSFYLHCPTDIHLHPASDSSAANISRFSQEVITTDAYRETHIYNHAWFHACVMARASANSSARTTLQDIVDKRPLTDLPTI